MPFKPVNYSHPFSHGRPPPTHTHAHSYLRLEVLEGLVAFYGGEPAATAESAFRGAQAKWRRLQVADGALAMLQVCPCVC